MAGGLDAADPSVATYSGRVARIAPRLLPVALALTLPLTGCSLFGGDDDPALPEPSLSASPVEPAEPEEEAQPDLARFYDQELDWTGCGGNECAELEVPLDYADPDGETITLSVLKVPAGDPGQRVGSLVVNPGGPGGSGVDYASNASSYFGPELQQAFDVVGFDPRGVGRSTPLDCLTDAQLDTFVAADPDPDTDAEVAAVRQAAARVRAGLRRRERRPDRAHVDRRGGQATSTCCGRRSATASSATSARRTAPSSARPTPSCSPSGSGGWCSTARSTRR